MSKAQDLSTLKAFNKAFQKFAILGLPACTIYQKPQNNEHLNHGATAIYTSEIKRPNMSEAQAKKIGLLDKTIQGMIWLESNIHPYGVTNSKDIGRTYTIHVEFKGIIKLTQRRWEHGTFIKYYNYARTIEQAIQDFQAWLTHNFRPFQWEIEKGLYKWTTKY